MLDQNHTSSYQTAVSTTMLILLNVASFALHHVTRLLQLFGPPGSCLNGGQLNLDLSHYNILYRDWINTLEGTWHLTTSLKRCGLYVVGRNCYFTLSCVFSSAQGRHGSQALIAYISHSVLLGIWEYDGLISLLSKYWKPTLLPMILQILP